MVELVRAGRTPEKLSREFEAAAQSIRNWVRQADLDEGRRKDGLSSAEREELRRLCRGNRQLKLEREILAKATAWFARETGSVPGKSSNSWRFGTIHTGAIRPWSINPLSATKGSMISCQPNRQAPLWKLPSHGNRYAIPTATWKPHSGFQGSHNAYGDKLAKPK